MTRFFCLFAGFVISLALTGCATVDGVPQTPCQRAVHLIDAARDAVRIAVESGADPVVIAKLNNAIDDAQSVASAACAAASA